MSKRKRAPQGEYLARQARENRELTEENRSLVQAIDALVRENEALATRKPAGPTERRGHPIRTFFLYFSAAAMLTVIVGAGVVMQITGGPPSAQELREGVSNLRHFAKTAVNSF